MTVRKHTMYVHGMCVFRCVCMFVFVVGTVAQQPCKTFLNPTENLKEVVIAKCTVYQQFVNEPQFCDGTTFHPVNCTELWEKFSSAFLYQPLCNVSENRYDDFIRLTDYPIPKDTALFWENTYPFVERFSNNGASYTTLAETLTGYIGNMLQWCSDETHGLGQGLTICPSWVYTPDCPQSAQRAFWIAASRNFGLRARGEIFIMLNASSDPIYANTTYLAEFELPFLTTKVTKATILMVNENPISKTTKCADPSLVLLEDQMKAQSIQYECIENRRDVVNLFCFDYPKSALCSAVTEDTNDAARTITPASFGTAGLVILVVKQLL